MQKLLITLIIILASYAHAQSVTTVIPPFQGEIIALDNLSITQIEFKVENQYCSVGTCAGGPAYHKAIPMIIQQDNSSVFQFHTESSIRLRSNRLFGNFNKCSLHLIVTGRRANGELRKGYAWIASTSDRNNCRSEKYMLEKISEELARPVLVKPDLGDFLRIEF